MTKKKEKKVINDTSKKQSNKRTELQKEVDRELILALRIKRWTKAKIGRHPNLSHISSEQVYYDINVLEKRFREKNDKDLAVFKSTQIATLNDVITENYESWENSKQDRIKKSLEKKSLKADGKDVPVEQKERAETQNSYGDPAYMKRIIEAIKEQNKMLGLYSIASSDGDTGALDNLVAAMDASYKFYNKDKEKDE